MAALPDNWWDVSGDQFTQSMQGITPTQAQSMGLYGQPAASVAAFDWLNPSTWSMKGFNQWGKDSGMFGGKAPDGSVSNGWGGMSIDLFKSLSGFLDGRDRYDLAKKSLAFEKQKYATDTYNQATGINSQLAARNDRRVAEGLMPTMSTADYMAKYGMKTA